MADWLWVSYLCGGSAKGDYSSIYAGLSDSETLLSHITVTFDHSPARRVLGIPRSQLPS